MVTEPTPPMPGAPGPAIARSTAARRRVAVAALALVTVAGAAACGSDSGTSTAPSVTASSGSPSSTTGSTAGTTPKGTTPTGTTPKGTTPGTAPSTTAGTLPTADGGGINSELEAALEAPDVTWSLNASAYRDQRGVRFGFDCPPGGTPGAVWGSIRYTDDSSVCTAAVHAGFITFEDGGRVVIEVRAGDSSYKGSDKNGVVSLDFDEFPGTFIFPGEPAQT